MINKDDIITTDAYLDFCKKIKIDYIKTDFFYIGNFIWRGQIHPSNNIGENLVVGHSDYPVNDEILSRINFDNIFCVNRNTNNENVYGIPLGITNDCDDSPRHRIYGNKEIMIEVMSDYNIKKDNLVYMNFNIGNYPDERKYLFDKFKNEKWVKYSDQIDTLVGRKNYLNDIKSSKFVFCPRGNGIDTHRLWESLYMGSIPIVRYENTHHLFKDLPILFIEDWDIINEKFLEKKYKEMLTKEYNLEKLKLSYWLDFIKNKTKK